MHIHYLHLFLSFAPVDKEAGAEAQDTDNQRNEDIQGNFTFIFKVYLINFIKHGTFTFIVIMFFLLLQKIMPAKMQRQKNLF